MNRKLFITAALTTINSVSLTMIARAELPANQESKRRSCRTVFVLIHGSWHGAWCYEKVAAFLNLQGYPVVARDLPGHGLLAKFPTSYFNRPLPLQGDFNTEPSPVASISLSDYVQQVVNIVYELAKQGSKVILVGHSLAGIILNAVGEKLGPKLIQLLVYLSAFMPVSNSPITEIFTRASQADSKVPPLQLADPAQVGALRIDFNSVDPAYQSLTKAAFFADISEEDFRAIANLLTPDDPTQPFNALVELTPQKWGRIPRTFIQCTQDQAIRPATQAQMIADIDAFTPGNEYAGTLPELQSYSLLLTTRDFSQCLDRTGSPFKVNRIISVKLSCCGLQT